MRCGRLTAKAITSAMSSAGDGLRLVHLLDGLLGVGMRDVVGQLGRHGAGLDYRHADVGLELLAQRLRLAVHTPLGRGVDRVSWARRAPRHRGEVHEVAAAVAELVEEHLGRGHGAQQVDLHHLAVLGLPVGGERCEQHDAGVVDEDVCAAQLVLHALGRGDDGVAVGDVGRDGDRAVAELVGERLDAVAAAGQQRERMAVGSQRAGGGLADARRRPVMTATRPLV
jgi:hypothetical protein